MNILYQSYYLQSLNRNTFNGDWIQLTPLYLFFNFRRFFRIILNVFQLWLVFFILFSKQLSLDYYSCLDAIVFLSLILLWDEYKLLFGCFRQRGRRKYRRQRLCLLIINAQEVLVEKMDSVFAASFVSDIHWQSELEIQCAYLTDIFLFTAEIAHACPFEDAFVTLPLEDGERAKTNAALLSEIFLEHAQVRVFAIAFITGNWKISRLPSLFIDATFGGHSSFSSHGALTLIIISRIPKWQTKIYPSAYIQKYHGILFPFMIFSNFQ